jgi:hypothetical protein
MVEVYRAFMQAARVVGGGCEMSLLDEYRKRKEAKRPKEKVKLTMKDWITTTLSILAFLLSTISAYFTSLRQSDRLSIILSSTPAIFIQDKKIVPSSFLAVFVNSGNRAAVVHHMILAVDQETPGRDRANCPKAIFAGWDVEGLVVKEKEIANKLVKLGGAGGIDPKIPISEENLKRGTFPLEVCLSVRLSTPSQAMIEKRVSIIRDENFSVARGFSVTTAEGYALGPFVLVARSGNIFMD